MNNLEIVETFVKNYKKHFKKFALTQLVIDIIEIAVFVVAILKTTDEENLFLIVTVSMLAIMMLTVNINIKICFGSFKKFSESGIISREYTDAKKALDKCSTEAHNYSELKANFDRTINTLAEKLKNLE